MSDDPTTTPARAPRLTAALVAEALASFGFPGVTGPESIAFPAPITRDGPGWWVEVDLPAGVTPQHIADREPGLAAALGASVRCIPVPGADGGAMRLFLRIGDHGDAAGSRCGSGPGAGSREPGA